MLLPWAQNTSGLDLAARLYQDLLEGRSQEGRMKHLTGNRGGPQAKDGSQSSASEIPGEHIQQYERQSCFPPHLPVHFRSTISTSIPGLIEALLWQELSQGPAWKI